MAKLFVGEPFGFSLLFVAEPAGEAEIFPCSFGEITGRHDGLILSRSSREVESLTAWAGAADSVGHHGDFCHLLEVLTKISPFLGLQLFFSSSEFVFG